MSTLRSLLLRLAIAAALSFALWGFVSFSENPDQQVTFEELTPVVRGLAAGLVLVDQNSLPGPSLPKVTVTLTTDRRHGSQLRALDVTPMLDLSGLTPGSHLVPVEIELEDSAASFNTMPTNIVPSTIALRVELQSEATVPIVVELRGRPPYSYELGTPTTLINGKPAAEIVVSGPESRVGRVVAVRVNANVDQLSATYSAPLQPAPVDASGEVVEGVTVRPEMVDVSIPVRPVVGLKVVPVQAVLSGLPAAGYKVAAVEVAPLLIRLNGSSGQLDAVEAVLTAPVDIAGQRSTVSREVALSFPPNTSPQVGEPSTVKVTVRIVALDQPFLVSLPVAVTVVGAPPGLLVGFSPNQVVITITGTIAALDQLQRQPLRGTLDAQGRGPGNHQLPLQVALPPDVALVGDPPVVLLSLRLPATPVPTKPVPSATSHPAPTSAPSAVPSAPASQVPATPPEAPPTSTEAPSPPPSAQPPTEAPIPPPQELPPVPSPTP